MEDPNPSPNSDQAQESKAANFEFDFYQPRLREESIPIDNNAARPAGAEVADVQAAEVQAANVEPEVAEVIEQPAAQPLEDANPLGMEQTPEVPVRGGMTGIARGPRRREYSNALSGCEG